MFHSKAQRLAPCVPQHPQMAPAAICQLGPAVEPKETRVSGSIYESTHPPGMRAALRNFQQSLSWELGT